MLQITKRLPLFFLLIFAATPQTKLPDSEAQHALSVCEILADPLRYNDQPVTIHGASVATAEGWWIESDRTCGKPLKTYGYTWPSTIWVQSVSETTPGRGGGLRTDDSAVRKIDSEVRRMHIDPKVDRILLKFTGVFQTREFKPEEVSTLRAYGFGHLNSAPGQLLLKTISDLHVEHVAPQR